MKQLGRLVILALMTTILMAPGLAGTASAQDASLCETANAQGPDTEVGEYDVVLLTGGAGSQIVLGYGNSTLSGGSGSDILCAWGSDNILDGGSGNDVLYAPDDGNTFSGGSGNDTMIGIAGDTFDGGSGNNSWTELATYDLWLEEWAGFEGKTFVILGSAFTSDSTVSLLIATFDHTGDIIYAVLFPDFPYPFVTTDSEGNFNTGIDPRLPQIPGCIVDEKEIAYVTISAIDINTGDYYTETFTHDETCFA